MVIMSFLQSNVSKPLRSWNLKLTPHLRYGTKANSSGRQVFSAQSANLRLDQKNKSLALLFGSLQLLGFRQLAGFGRANCARSLRLKITLIGAKEDFQRRSNAKRLHFKTFKTFKTFKVSSLPVSAGTLVHVSFITASLDRYFCVKRFVRFASSPRRW